MNLRGDQLEKTQKALISAYPSITALKMMVKHKLEENLDEIAQGQNLREVVFLLMEWAESQGKLKQLIKSAHEYNPGNQELKDIYNKLFPNFSNYAGIEFDTCPISNEQWSNLHGIISKINLELLAQVCRITLQNIDKDKDILGNYPELIQLNKIDELKHILLQQCTHNEENIPTIVEFAKRLAKEKEVGESQQNKLNQWVENIAKELNLTLPTYSEAKSSTILQSYLMITVFPSPKSANKFYLEAELIRDYLANDANQRPMKLELNQESANVECSFQEIADKIHKLIGIAKREHLKQDTHYLTIEIFLPLQLLGTSIDLEEIPIGFNRRRPIGNEYKFLVRSLDRFISNYGEYVNRLSLRWEQLTKFFQKIPSQTDLQNKIHHISQVDDCNWDEIQADLDIKEKLGVKMTWCLPEADFDKEELFIAVLRGGVPIAFWTRSNTIPNIEQEFDELLKIEYFQRDFSSLIESVWTLRRMAHAQRDKENYLGYNLGFLCDNPNRVPFHLMLQNQSFIETGM